MTDLAGDYEKRTVRPHMGAPAAAILLLRIATSKAIETQLAETPYGVRAFVSIDGERPLLLSEREVRLVADLCAGDERLDPQHADNLRALAGKLDAERTGNA
jgi:hypothetical protein